MYRASPHSRSDMPRPSRDTPLAATSGFTWLERPARGHVLTPDRPEIDKARRNGKQGKLKYKTSATNRGLVERMSHRIQILRQLEMIPMMPLFQRPPPRTQTPRERFGRRSFTKSSRCRNVPPVSVSDFILPPWHSTSRVGHHSGRPGDRPATSRQVDLGLARLADTLEQLALFLGSILITAGRSRRRRPEKACCTAARVFGGREPARPGPMLKPIELIGRQVQLLLQPAMFRGGGRDSSSDRPARRLRGGNRNPIDQSPRTVGIAVTAPALEWIKTIPSAHWTMSSPVRGNTASGAKPQAARPPWAATR